MLAGALRDFHLSLLKKVVDGDKEASSELEALIIDTFKEYQNTGTGSPERRSKRALLIALGGYYQFIDTSSLKKKVKSFQKDLSFNLPIEEKIEFQHIAPSQLFSGLEEVPLKALLIHPYFMDLFTIEDSQGKSYIDRYLEDRESLLAKIVFDSDVRDGTGEDLSSTSEVLSRTIILSPRSYSGSDDFRDPGTIVFDVILQLTYLHYFWKNSGENERDSILSAMYANGLEYALDLFRFLVEGGEECGYLRLINDDKIYIEHQNNEEAYFRALYIQFLLESLIRGSALQLESTIDERGKGITGILLESRKFNFDLLEKEVELTVES